MRSMQNVKRRSAPAILVAILIAVVGLGGSTALAKPNLEPRPSHVTQVAEFVNVGTCAYGAPVQEITGTGQASHLGRFESYGLACLSAATNLVTWTAANGDEIVIEYTSEVGTIGPDGSASIAFTAVNTAGTGRFAKVSFGEDDVLAGTVWFAPDGTGGRLEVSLDGTIAYDASDRSDR